MEELLVVITVGDAVVLVVSSEVELDSVLGAGSEDVVGVVTGREELVIGTVLDSVEIEDVGTNESDEAAEELGVRVGLDIDCVLESSVAEANEEGSVDSDVRYSLVTLLEVVDAEDMDEVDGEVDEGV